MAFHLTYFFSPNKNGMRITMPEAHETINIIRSNFSDSGIPCPYEKGRPITIRYILPNEISILAPKPEEIHLVRGRVFWFYCPTERILEEITQRCNLKFDIEKVRGADL